VTWPTPLESDALERRHVLFSWAICLEAAVCFAGLGFVLCLGTIFLPIVIGRVLAGDVDAWAAYFVLMVVMGWCGLGAVGRVVFLLCTRQRHDQRAGWTLLGLACGVGLTLFIWHSGWTDDMRQDPTRLAFAYLPLACTAHLVYLARRALFTRPTALS
jgi:hypothetical protein